MLKIKLRFDNLKFLLKHLIKKYLLGGLLLGGLLALLGLALLGLLGLAAAALLLRQLLALGDDDLLGLAALARRLASLAGLALAGAGVLLLAGGEFGDGFTLGAEVRNGAGFETGPIIKFQRNLLKYFDGF